jgi:ABC-type branched-subunit amino acid transport system substrate-binding protein
MPAHVPSVRRPQRPSCLAGALVAVLGLAPALAGCDGAAAARLGAGGGDTLYIAVAATRTTTGTAYVRGVELAVEMLNRTRPEGARPFGVRLPPDSQLTQVEIAARFRDDPRVIGVVGHTGSAQTMEAGPVYGDVENAGRNAVVAVTPTATNPRVTLASSWVFRVCPTDLDAARALAQYASDSLAARRVAIIYRNDLFGRGFTRTFAPRAQALGIAVLERDPYLAGVTTYDAYARRIGRAGADVIVVAGGGPDVRDMVRAFRRAGHEPTILGSDDVASLASDTADAREFRGVRFAAFYLADRPVTAQGAEFARRYAARYPGEHATHRAALSYDAATLIGRAAIAVGPDRHEVRDWLARVGRDLPAHAGASGSIAFDSTRGAVNMPVVVGTVTPTAGRGRT